MNPEKKNTEVIEKIDEMVALLSILVRLSIPTLQPDEHLLKDDQENIYNLCDAMHTIEEIAEIVGKPQNQINSSLTRLRKKGLIDSVIKRNNVYYFRLPYSNGKKVE